MSEKYISATSRRMGKVCFALVTVSIVCVTMPGCKSKAEEDVAEIREILEKQEVQSKADQEASVAQLHLIQANRRASRNPAWSTLSQSEKDKAIQAELKEIQAAYAARTKAKAP